MVGSRDFFRNSNLILNHLPFDLMAFKNLKHLCFNSANLSSLICARNLRTSLKSLAAHSCGLKSVVDILVCDNVHKRIEGKVPITTVIKCYLLKYKEATLSLGCFKS